MHNYQRFTNVVKGPKGQLQTPLVVRRRRIHELGKLQKINGAYPDPSDRCHGRSGLTLEHYDHDNFGFLRLEVSKTQIVGTYTSAPYVSGGPPASKVVDTFTVDLVKNTVTTGAAGDMSGRKGPKKPPKPAKTPKPPKKT